MPRTVIDGYNLLLRDLDPAGSSLADVREEFLRRVDAARPAAFPPIVFGEFLRAELEAGYDAHKTAGAEEA